MSFLPDTLSWLGDHVTGPVLNPVLGIAGIGNQSPYAAASGTDLYTGQQTPTGAANQKAGVGPTGAVALGSPFAGASKWLAGFGVLAGVVLLMGGSKWEGFGTALLAVILAAYFFASFGQLRDGFNHLFGTGF